jgi:4-alpha-glucanotransferase
MNPLADRAAEFGIETEYFDAFGQRQAVSPAALAAILRAIDADANRPGKAEARSTVTPCRAYQADEVFSRSWLLAVQLYAVRSRRNWGHGDFTDLAAMIDLAADIGAGGIGLNPLHVLFDDRPAQASPYAPNSRLFLNPLYIDVAAIPEFPGVEAAGLSETIERLRGAEQVDYAGVAQAKIAGLRLAYELFRAAPTPERLQDFTAFREERGLPLAQFASFEVLRRRFPQPWWEWPEPWRSPDDAALALLRHSEDKAVGFHEFVQWIADRQLAACRARAHAQHLPIGLYLDIAVGVEPGGADAWAAQGAILRSLSAGAPPDQFNPGGQNWGIAAFNPRGLVADDFAMFRRTIAAAMRHAGAIRIDHVLGLNRLFLIPHGAPPQDGAYFRFPLEAMLAVVAEESHARRCIVIGEDLGTVPADLRGKLAAWGIWSYRVLMFERAADGGFVGTDQYPAMALSTFSTHDLPTFAGWSSGHDLDVRENLGLQAGESKAARQDSRERLRATLAHAGFDLDAGFAAIAGFLAATPSRLVAVGIEDLLGVYDQPNMPATVDEHPNWRQRLPVLLEEWAAQPLLGAVADIFAQAGRSARPGSQLRSRRS